MLSLGFTGTRDGMTDEQKDEVEKLLGQLVEADCQFHHGDCIGADYEAAQLAQCLGYKIIGHPPSNPRSRAFFESDREVEPKGYLERNRDIVDIADALIATPKSIVEEIKGSGTWYTVRYARKKIPVYLVLPTGRLVIQ